MIMQQHVAVGLRVHVQREILAADVHCHDPRARPRDLVDAGKGVGGLDHHDELGVPGLHAALRLELAHQLVEQPHVRRAVRLGDGDAVHVREHRVLEVAHGERQRLVDAHHHVRTALAHARGVLLDQHARLLLFGGRHRVFQVELDHVGAAGVRFLDEFLDVDGHVEQRAPYREIGLHHSSSCLFGEPPSHTAPAATSRA
jgi:hypothetical protein